MSKRIPNKHCSDEENVSEVIISSNQREGILRKKPWTEEEDQLVKKLV